MKSLIIYASKYGSTKLCAEKLAKLLLGEVDIVQVSVDSIPDLSSYNHIIIGSPIRMGVIDSKIRAFCKGHENTLYQHSVAMFLCGGLEAQVDTALKASLSENLYAHIDPIQYVGGIMDVKRANFFDKLIIKMATYWLKKEQNPLPQIEEKNIQSLANVINAK